MTTLLHDLIATRAECTPEAPALRYRKDSQNYGTLMASVQRGAGALLAAGLRPRDRVVIYLEKRPENLHALFGASLAGGVFVPANPQLKPQQVDHILRDCGARILVTSAARLTALRPLLPRCPELHTVLVVDDAPPPTAGALRIQAWGEAAVAQEGHRGIDADMAAILYTSGSTGRPKGVVLSHRNLVAGARSVAAYLENRPNDRILALLPLSFDYGLSQLTTAFASGASVVLLNYLLPQDVVSTVEREGITGLAAVPPLWIQLAALSWPEAAQRSLRYLTNSGGAIPRHTLDALRSRLPASRLYLMYGLTEAFRSTYLPPEELERRPDSIGRAIPNAEVQVVREDGTPCAPDEPGELVHRGALVAMGYWNDPARTARRFRPAPGQPKGLPLPEMAVWSGDTVRRDAEGFLYFIGRRDGMIKSSGYRVSPEEVEEVAYATGLVAEAVALGLPHPLLGQGILLLAQPRDDDTVAAALLDAMRPKLPAWMVPGAVVLQPINYLLHVIE